MHTKQAVEAGLEFNALCLFSCPVAPPSQLLFKIATSIKYEERYGEGGGLRFASPAVGAQQIPAAPLQKTERGGGGAGSMAEIEADVKFALVGRGTHHFLWQEDPKGGGEGVCNAALQGLAQHRSETGEALQCCNAGVGGKEALAWQSGWAAEGDQDRSSPSPSTLSPSSQHSRALSWHSPD